LKKSEISIQRSDIRTRNFEPGTLNQTLGMRNHFSG
jgi:hypothetical protein